MRHLGSGALLAGGLWPGSLAAAGRSKAAGGSFRFVVVNDTHVLDEPSAAWLANVVGRIRAANPELCIVAGDLANDGTVEQLTLFREAFRDLGVPVQVTPGNHDYFGPADRGPYDTLFPGPVNRCFEHRGWQFVGLDTTEGQKWEKTRIQPETFRWCDERLRRLDPARPTVVFTHFPLGDGVTYRPVNAEDLLDRFRSLNLQAVFSGHFHGFTERHRRGGALTTNRCCALRRENHDGTKEKGWFICDTVDGHIIRRFEPVSVPKSS